MKTQLATARALAALALPALTLPAAPALADSMQTLGPPAPEMVQIASYYAPAGTFFLADGQIQVIRFSGNASHRVCLEAGAAVAPVAAGALHRVVPLQVNWRNQQRTVYPGECTRVDAQLVTVRPGAGLGRDEALRAHVGAAQIAAALPSS